MTVTQRIRGWIGGDQGKAEAPPTYVVVVPPWSQVTVADLYAEGYRVSAALLPWLDRPQAEWPASMWFATGVQGVFDWIAGGKSPFPGDPPATLENVARGIAVLERLPHDGTPGSWVLRGTCAALLWLIGESREVTYPVSSAA